MNGTEQKQPARTPLELEVMLLLAKADRRGVYRFLALQAKAAKQPTLQKAYWRKYYLEDEAISQGLRDLNRVTR